MFTGAYANVFQGLHAVWLITSYSPILNLMMLRAPTVPKWWQLDPEPTRIPPGYLGGREHLLPYPGETEVIGNGSLWLCTQVRPTCLGRDSGYGDRGCHHNLCPFLGLIFPSLCLLPPFPLPWIDLLLVGTAGASSSLLLAWCWGHVLTGTGPALALPPPMNVLYGMFTDF